MYVQDKKVWTFWYIRERLFYKRETKKFDILRKLLEAKSQGFFQGVRGGGLKAR